MRTQPVWLGPFRRLNGQRVSDRVLGGTFMRGGFNFEVRDGEWWSRKGEECAAPRLGSTPWWWMFNVNRDLTIIANPWYALKIEESGGAYKVSQIYNAVVTESVTFTNGSKTATPTTTRIAGQLMLVGTQPTSEVYRVTAATSAPSITLDRAYEGTSGAKSVAFLNVISQDLSGTRATHDDTARVIGGACIFEQLVTHTAADVSPSNPAVTGGHIFLIITSNQGAPAAIDLTAVGNVLRNWFYLTNLGAASATAIGSDTATDGITPRGVYASVYKNRLFIAAATDPNGQYGSRTLYYSQIGDFLNWHSGNTADLTAVPNFKTFDGEGNSIGGMDILGDDLVIHRDDSQEIATATQSGDTPFVFRTSNENLGIRDFRRSNRVVAARGRHFIWTRRGLFAFDGRNLTPLAEDARGSLQWNRFMQVRDAIRHVVHDSQNGRIYWFSANVSSRWNTYAAPASANYTTVDGASVQNYYGVFVYDYENDTYWFEDRPASIGGGMMTLDATRPSAAHASRTDGSIVVLSSRSKGKDPALSTYNGSGVVVKDPTNSAHDVAVTCVAETPWMDFGSPNVKRMTRIETHERALVGEGPYDNYNDIESAKRVFRIQIYGDMNPEVSIGELTTMYDASDSTTSDQITSENVVQASSFVREFTPRSDARQFKLILSNTKSAGATFINAYSAPIRLSDMMIELTPLDSLQPKTAVNSTVLSGV